MRSGRRWLSSFLTVVMLVVSMMPQSALASTKQKDIQYSIKESVNEDKTSATVELEITEAEGNTLTEVILPDGSSVFPEDTDGVAGFEQKGKKIVHFTVTENGTISFVLKYDSESEVEADPESTKPPVSSPSDADEAGEEPIEDDDNLILYASDASASDAEFNDNDNMTSEEPIVKHKSMTVTHKVTSFSELRAALPELKTLTIRYYIQGDTAMIAEPYIATQLVGTDYAISSPDIEKFELADNSQAVVSGTLDDNIQINVYYTYAPKTANYTIKYMLQNPTTKLYEENTTETVTGTSPIGDIIAVEDKIFTGYERQDSELFLEITGDNPTKELYYDSIDQPYIIFQTDGSYIEPISAQPGTDISGEAATVAEPTRQGYTFNGWDKTIPTTMPSEDVVINATWTPGTSNYTVIHWLQNADDDNYVMSDDIEVRTGVTEAMAADFDAKTYDNFNYSHKDDNVEITADGHAVLNVYYNRRIIGFTFLNKDGSEWCSFSGRYGSLVPDDFPTPDDCKEYYDKQYTAEIALGEKFVTMCSKIDITSLYSPIRFIFLGTQAAETNLELIPEYKSTSTLFEAHTYVQCLPGESGVIQEKGLWYKHLDTKSANISGGSVTFYIKIPTGFVYVMGRIPVWYRQGDSLQEAFAAGASNFLKASQDNQVYARISQPYSVWGFRRFQGTVTYSSKAADIQTLSDIYYEQDIDLTVTPTNGGTDEHFVGWYTSPELFATSPLTTYQMPPTNTTLYAKWVRNNHTLTFESNGGSAIAPLTVMGGTSADAPTEPTKAGFAFTGWYKADGTRWSFDMTVEDDVTLYAHWKRANKVNYTVEHYNLDTGTMLKQESLTAYIGDTMVARALTSQDAEYPADTYLVPDFASKSLLVSRTAANVIRFEYKDPTIKDYTVHYYEQGTTNELKTSKTVTGTKNTVVTEFAEAVTDYTADAEVKQAILIYDTTNTIVFYYQRGITPPQTQYSVTYSPNDTFASGAVIDSSSPYTAGDTVTVLTNAFTNGSKEFIGWNTQADGGGASYDENDTFAMPANEIILYAQWRTTSPLPGVTVTFTVVNGSWDDGTTVNITVPIQLLDGHGTLMSKDVPVNMQPNPGYEGGSWNETPNVTVDGITADVTYTYTFKKQGGGGSDPTYTVTYNANGGTGTLIDPNSPYIAGATVTVLANEFANGSKKFTGWNTQAGGGGSIYAVNTNFTMPSANVVFYAQWKSTGGGSSSGGSSGGGVPPTPMPPTSTLPIPTLPEPTFPVVPVQDRELDDIPKTSDSSNTSLWLLLMGLSLMGLLGTSVISRKKGASIKSKCRIK